MNIIRIILSSLLITFLTAPLSIKANNSLTNAKTNEITVKRDIISTLNSVDLINKSGWISYQVKMEAQNRIPCCFDGHNTKGCSLSEHRNNWGINHQQEDSTVLNIYFKWIDNKPSELFLAGSECGVNSDGKTVSFLSSVSQKQSIRFLERYLTTRDNKTSRQARNKALIAIALHKGDFAQTTLEKLANAADGKINHQAIFWLGEARNRAGYKSLEKIIEDDDRKINTRKKAVFALSQNSFEKSKDKLLQLASKTGQDKIQAEAIFWLTQSQDKRAADVIEKVLASDASRFVMKKTVFAISMLKEPYATNGLIKLIKGNNSRYIKKKALFWLGQSNQPEAIKFLEKILTASIN